MMKIRFYFTSLCGAGTLYHGGSAAAAAIQSSIDLFCTGTQIHRLAADDIAITAFIVAGECGAQQLSAIHAEVYQLTHCVRIVKFVNYKDSLRALR